MKVVLPTTTRRVLARILWHAFDTSSLFEQAYEEVAQESNNHASRATVEKELRAFRSALRRTNAHDNDIISWGVRPVTRAKQQQHTSPPSPEPAQQTPSQPQDAPYRSSRSRSRRGITDYFGVYVTESGGRRTPVRIRYKAAISYYVNGVRIYKHLGYYDTAQEAAARRDEAVLSEPQLSHLPLNFPESVTHASTTMDS